VKAVSIYVWLWAAVNACMWLLTSVEIVITDWSKPHYFLFDWIGIALFGFFSLLFGWSILWITLALDSTNAADSPK
jgi:hypothetical protein